MIGYNIKEMGMTKEEILLDEINALESEIEQLRDENLGLRAELSSLKENTRKPDEWISVEAAVEKWSPQDFWANEWEDEHGTMIPGKVTAEELYQLAYDYAIYIQNKIVPNPPKQSEGSE